MDMTAEYAHRYGGAPRADQPWHEVLALVRRIGRFEARDRLAMADAQALSNPLGDNPLRQMEVARLMRLGGH